ncbi:hypothetical protein EDD36DRAFT_292658 [Exophiala viscosa]|uniref:Uncharacterized protein n=1 Tax=Exophiala viscosa TaxID=2486360 RepID=A0AAN6IBR6_9EURO|nr:hypothetical protein EDD36DRAFT_292658 [Exophiala viscosa]
MVAELHRPRFLPGPSSGAGGRGWLLPKRLRGFSIQLVENLLLLLLHLTLFACQGANLPDHHLHFRSLDDHCTCSFCTAHNPSIKTNASSTRSASVVDQPSPSIQAAAVMASRLLIPRLSAASRAPVTSFASRSFQTSSRRFAEPVAVPVKRPVGAFRGGLFGFLLGSTLAGASVYYYILEEYKVSNELLTEDIYALQAAVQRIHSYVTELENKVSQIKK